MGPLQIASWAEYQGAARVNYSLIKFHSEKEKRFLARDAQRWEDILKHQQSRGSQLLNAPVVVVSDDALSEARRGSQNSSDSQTPPTLLFKEQEMICLDGQARIKATLNLVSVPGTEVFGPVHIVLNSIDDTRQSEILYGSSYQIKPSCGKLYNTILNADSYRRVQQIKSTLGPGELRGLRRLERCGRLRQAFDKVATTLPNITYGPLFSQFGAYHATQCEISIEKYWIGYILEFWEVVARETCSKLGDPGGFSCKDLPSQAFEKLEGLMPGVSVDDEEQVNKIFDCSDVFIGLNQSQRVALKETILAMQCIIPSMKLFTVHMRVLQKVASLMKRLLKLNGWQMKRSQGCVESIESVLKRLYTAEGNPSDEYWIQTRRGWRKINTRFDNRQELSCRQLWLFLLRYVDSDLDDSQLLDAAQKFGFHAGTTRTHSVAPIPSFEKPATDPEYPSLPEISVKRRLGPKAEEWLEQLRSVSEYLFFDTVETIGTRQGEKENFTALVEVACIYRAFYAHPSQPSRYARPSGATHDTHDGLPTAPPHSSHRRTAPMSLSEHDEPVAQPRAAPMASPMAPSVRRDEQKDSGTEVPLQIDESAGSTDYPMGSSPSDERMMDLSPSDPLPVDPCSPSSSVFYDAPEGDDVLASSPLSFPPRTTDSSKGIKEIHTLDWLDLAAGEPRNHYRQTEWTTATGDKTVNPGQIFPELKKPSNSLQPQQNLDTHSQSQEQRDDARHVYGGNMGDSAEETEVVELGDVEPPTMLSSPKSPVNEIYACSKRVCPGTEESVHKGVEQSSLDIPAADNDVSRTSTSRNLADESQEVEHQSAGLNPPNEVCESQESGERAPDFQRNEYTAPLDDDAPARCPDSISAGATFGSTEHYESAESLFLAEDVDTAEEEGEREGQRYEVHGQFDISPSANDSRDGHTTDGVRNEQVGDEPALRQDTFPTGQPSALSPERKDANAQAPDSRVSAIDLDSNEELGPEGSVHADGGSCSPAAAYMPEEAPKEHDEGSRGLRNSPRGFECNERPGMDDVDEVRLNGRPFVEEATSHSPMPHPSKGNLERAESPRDTAMADLTDAEEPGSLLPGNGGISRETPAGIETSARRFHPRASFQVPRTPPERGNIPNQVLRKRRTEGGLGYDAKRRCIEDEREQSAGISSVGVDERRLYGLQALGQEEELLAFLGKQGGAPSKVNEPEPEPVVQQCSSQAAPPSSPEPTPDQVDETCYPPGGGRGHGAGNPPEQINHDQTPGLDGEGEQPTDILHDSGTAHFAAAPAQETHASHHEFISEPEGLHGKANVGLPPKPPTENLVMEDPVMELSRTNQQVDSSRWCMDGSPVIPTMASYELAAPTEPIYVAGASPLGQTACSDQPWTQQWKIPGTMRVDFGAQLGNYEFTFTITGSVAPMRFPPVRVIRGTRTDVPATESIVTPPTDPVEPSVKQRKTPLAISMDSEDTLENEDHPELSAIQGAATTQETLETENSTYRPNKRMCLGIHSKRVADAHSKPDKSVVFIIEVVGQKVGRIHRRFRTSIKNGLERQFRMQSRNGMFLDQNMRIVELDPSEGGAISMVDFFSKKKVLVFQHSDNSNVDWKRLRNDVFTAVLQEKKKPMPYRSTKHKYYLRSKNKARLNKISKRVPKTPHEKEYRDRVATKQRRRNR